MKMERRTFRIGELAHALSLNGQPIEPFVIRFWEKEFGIQSHRSPGGQRFYTEEDFEYFLRIKELLYERRFTIEGAKRFFSAEAAPGLQQDTLQTLAELRKKLIRVRDLL